MESAGETAKEGGGRAVSVCNVLSGSGPVSITFWVGDLGLVGGNVPEDGGVAHGIINGTKVRASEGQDLEKCGSREGP